MVGGRIRECPFCGQYPKIDEKTQIIRLNSNKTNAKNMEYLGNTGYGSHQFRQTKYMLRCPDTHCPGHNNNFVDFDKDNLIERWNKRV